VAQNWSSSRSARAAITTLVSVCSTTWLASSDLLRGFSCTRSYGVSDPTILADAIPAQDSISRRGRVLSEHGCTDRQWVSRGWMLRVYYLSSLELTTLSVHNYGPPLSEFDRWSTGRLAETGRVVRREAVTAGMVSRGLRPGPRLSLTQAPQARDPATDRHIFRRLKKISEFSVD
jgi:hypothetical protein